MVQAPCSAPIALPLYSSLVALGPVNTYRRTSGVTREFPDHCNSLHALISLNGHPVESSSSKHSTTD